MDWRNATREDLGYHYSPTQWSRRMSADQLIQAHIETLQKGSELAKASIDCELEVSYGPSDRERLDIFGSKTLPADAPVFVYIHGGYWQLLGHEESSFMASTFCRAGAVVVALGYDLAPKVTMTEIVAQVTKGVAHILTMAQQRGSRGVYLCGHSAGAHLAAMMLAVNWVAQCGISNDFLKGAVLVSGIYDVRPLVNSYVNDPLKMTEEEAWRNSPNNWIKDITRRSKKRKIIVAVAEQDPLAFHHQSRGFNTELLVGGVDSLLIFASELDHFNVIENLQQEDYILTQESLKLMGLIIHRLTGDLEKLKP